MWHVHRRYHRRLSAIDTFTDATCVGSSSYKDVHRLGPVHTRRVMEVPRLIPNAGPAPFDWADRSEVGNDNGYRYSLFSIFDYEVLKYSWRSGRGIVIAPGGRGEPQLLPMTAVTRARIRDCTVHERAHSSADTFIYTATLVNFNSTASASRILFFYSSCYINEGNPE